MLPSSLLSKNFLPYVTSNPKISALISRLLFFFINHFIQYVISLVISNFILRRINPNLCSLILIPQRTYHNFISSKTLLSDLKYKTYSTSNLSWLVSVLCTLPATSAREVWIGSHMNLPRSVQYPSNWAHRFYLYFPFGLYAAISVRLKFVFTCKHLAFSASKREFWLPAWSKEIGIRCPSFSVILIVQSSTVIRAVGATIRNHSFTMYRNKIAENLPVMDFLQDRVQNMNKQMKNL